MRKLLIAAFLGLVVALPGQARPRPYNPVAIVKNWYRQYLHREAEPSGLEGWVAQLRQGEDPTYLLSILLGGQEYFQNAGGTPTGWITALFEDLVGRKPARRELRYWRHRLEGQTYQEVAYDMLRKFGGG
jgi:hypothetical protein